MTGCDACCAAAAAAADDDDDDDDDDTGDFALDDLAAFDVLSGEDGALGTMRCTVEDTISTLAAAAAAAAS